MSRTTSSRVSEAVIIVLLIHAGLLAWTASRHSPTLDEVAHLPAGISHWEFGRFDLYRVNPPLVRMLAASPVMLSGAQRDWSHYREGLMARPEWSIGRSFITANEKKAFFYFTLARWACIPLSLIGGYVCYRWARELYGVPSGLLALSLWCFSPNIIAWSSTITPDVGAAALGVASGYVFWRWLKDPSWGWTFFSGLMLGLVELTKMTWVILFGLWPLMWFVFKLNERQGMSSQDWRKQAIQVCVTLLLGLYVLNVGYGFEGSFCKLGDYTFVSRTLAGEESVADGEEGGNRFANNWMGQLPVPVPKNYISGIDLQKLDFEMGKCSYLNGEWKERGWWYYYIYALALKVPLGTWGLFLLAIGVMLSNQLYRAKWKNELVLLCPAIAVFLLVSSQTGFSRYLRYVLPCFPFVFIWISKVARCVEFRQWTIAISAGSALLWSVGSSLWFYPHSMSYFNEVAGGPKGGHRYLIDANIDWGQDLLYLKEWHDEHPEARPLHVSCYTFVSPDQYGIEFSLPPRGLTREEDVSRYSKDELQQLGPLPGWHALSVHRLHDRDGSYEYFLQHFEPIAMAGYSIYIYHITVEEANRVRRELGLPLLNETTILNRPEPKE